MVWRSGEILGDIDLPVPGNHNIYNALAATAVAMELDIPFNKIRDAFASFKNANRRFQFKGEVRGITVIDDYGHHPTEILATLAAAKNCAGGRRTVVVFQPHRYTRTQELMDEFALAFTMPTYFMFSIFTPQVRRPSKASPLKVLTDNIKRYGHKNATYIGRMEDAADIVCSELQKAIS